MLPPQPSSYMLDSFLSIFNENLLKLFLYNFSPHSLKCAHTEKQENCLHTPARPPPRPPHTPSSLLEGQSAFSVLGGKDFASTAVV